MEDQDLNGAEGRLAEQCTSDGQAGTTGEGERLQSDCRGRDPRRARQNQQQRKPVCSDKDPAQPKIHKDIHIWASLTAQLVKNLPAMEETPV